MLRRIVKGGRSIRRHGVIAVQVAVLIVVLMGFAALTVDVGAMYNTRADIQRTADSAALAAAAMLATPGREAALEAARTAAVDYTQRNNVFGREMDLETGDIVFGRVTLGETGSYEFVETEYLPDAVRVVVRHTEDSTNGSMPLYFAKIFGISHANLQADAVAMMIPRDIAIVADLSGSHNDDSELQRLGETDINLLDVWADLPVNRGVNGVGDGVTRPAPGDPLDPAGPPDYGPGHAGNGGNDPGTTANGGQDGPTFGRMYFWGDSLNDGYVIANDPALMHLPQYQDWNDADLVEMYQHVGYSDLEIDALLSGAADNYGTMDGQWANRVAVALGLARWDSGLRGGLWERAGRYVGDDPEAAVVQGNGDGLLNAGEVVWLVDYPFTSGSWQEYIYDYMRRPNTAMANAHPAFRERFGLKTFSNYLLERRYRHYQVPELADTPHQPMRAVKDAITHMATMIMGMQTDDQLSLESYGTYGHHEVDLTHQHNLIINRVADLQAGHYDPWTNVGAGLHEAIVELSSERARERSIKMIILLTDGNANVSQDGQTGNTDAGGAWALDRASAAAAQGIRIFAVSVGSNSNQSLMQQIADIGQGEHFHAEGSIEEYSQQLEEIFRHLGGTRPVELIQ